MVVVIKVTGWEGMVYLENKIVNKVGYRYLRSLLGSLSDLRFLLAGEIHSRFLSKKGDNYKC